MPSGMLESSGPPAAVPPPPVSGALVLMTVLVVLGLGVALGVVDATILRLALPVSLVPSHLALIS